MGGKAVNFVRRYDAKEYHSLVAEFLPQIKNLLNTPCVVLEAYAKKETFGDMDVLIFIPNGFDYTVWRQLVIDTFQPSDVDINTNVMSIAYQELQIDLIFTQEDYWQSTQNFFKFNDMGNLCGKLAHRFGCKYGQKGLVYVYRTIEDRVLGEFIISQDMSKILPFLGLDYQTWINGFKTDLEIFDYIRSSKYFNVEDFKLENLNAINRKRNSKRKMYNEFVTYCENLVEDRQYYQFNKDKSTYWPYIQQHFPDFYDNLQHLKDLEIKRLAIKDKFNGKMLMLKWPHLKAEVLGNFIQNFKDSIENFDNWLEITSQEDIWIKVEDFYMSNNFNTFK